MSDASSTHRKGRSKSGCQTCRARKIRCDERPGVCLNCERLGLPCTGAEQSPDHRPSDGREAYDSTVATGLKRKRTFRSCIGCRASKTRCSGEKPVCVRCREKSIQCNYEDSSEPAWKQQLRFAATLEPSSDNGNVVGGAVTAPQPNHIGEQSGTIPWRQRPSGDRPREGMDNRMHRQSQEGYWCLWSSHLPGSGTIRALVEYYFMNIHPLRCFGFLHKPSFMQRLDADDANFRNDALLHIVCALGALFLAAESETATKSSASTRAAGGHWAKRAQQLILSQLGDIMVENLMAAVLLQDYELRMGNFGNAFMLSGISARMAQALQVNLEHSTDVLCHDSASGPGASTKESRRRLMWCCYITDSLVGSGVDQLTLIKEADIKIQLPCNERNFLLQTPCITEVLEQGQFLRFLHSDIVPSSPLDNMGIRAYYLRYISIRRKILKYIKHLNIAKPPWLPDSEFAQLDAESRAWYESLPTSLHWKPSAMYIRKETMQLGALCSLHYMYHQTMCDFYRIGAPALYKLRSAFSFPPEQTGFLTHLRNELFAHARSLAIITAEATRHGPHALADSWVPTIAYDCCRVMLYYLTQLIDPLAEQSKKLLSETVPMVRSNIKALRMMQSMYAVAELLSNAAEKMLEKVLIGSALTGQSIIPDEPYNETNDNEHSAPGTPVQSAPDYVLNPLSIYRMARKSIPEKHAPEKQASSSSATVPGRNTLQRRATLQHIPYETMASGTDHNATTSAQVNSQDLPPDQTGLDDLLPLFTNDPSGWTWHPSDTAIGSYNEPNGLPPWEPYVDQQLDAWMPMFSSQPYGFQ